MKFKRYFIQFASISGEADFCWTNAPRVCYAEAYGGENMEDQITVNGRVLSIRRLLGRGKGGYSYLAADERGEYVVKQIHHEPCEYYQFGDKLAAEQRDYERLLSAGIPMPRLLDVDTENERILKEYIPGPTAAELIAENRLPGFCLRQLKAMCARLYPVHLNIDYYPTNFVLSVDRLYYVDYECNDYSPKWDFEHWGAQYWTGQE